MSEQDNTDDLLKSLEARASDKPVEEDNTPPEDIDAFLADLEEDQAPASAAAATPGESDPFADAFASLGGDDDELTHDPAIAAKLAALAPPKPKPKPKPVPEVIVAPTPPPEATLPARPEPKAAPEEAVEESSKKSKKEKKKDKKNDLVKVVETQRSGGFLLAMGLLKWSVIFTPVIVFIWIAGALLSSWLETGWMILALATLPAIMLPFVPKIAFKRGRWWHWAVPLALIGSAVCVAPWPSTTGLKLSHYGHWPSSTVAQLANFQPDSAFVRTHAYVAELIGDQLISLKPSVTPLTEADKLARALGTETELVAWASARRDALKKAAPVTPDPEVNTKEEPPASEKEQAPAPDAVEKEKAPQ